MRNEESRCSLPLPLPWKAAGREGEGVGRRRTGGMERAGVRSNMFAQVEADAYRRITVFVVVVVDTLAGGGTEGGGGGRRCVLVISGLI